MKKLSIMDQTGDRVIEFDETEATAAAEAKELFERLTGQGYTAFAFPADPSQPGEVIKGFADVNEDTVLRPRMYGG